MIRILVFGMSYNLGGVETFVYNYMSRLQLRDEFQIDFLSIHEKMAFEEELQALGCRVISVPDAKKNPMQAEKRMEDVMRQGRYDILHVNMLSAANITPLVAGKKAGIPHIIAHSHNSQVPPGFLRKLLHTLNQKKLPKLADTLFACSEAAGRWLFPYSRDFTLIRNASDEQKFKYQPKIRAALRQQQGWEHALVFGHVGRFQYQKNHSFLLDVFQELHRRVPDSRLLLIGTGELLPEMKQKAETLGLKASVIFAGFQENIPDWLQAMDVALLPSHFEGLPLSAVEAQAAGLPLITSDAVSPEACITPLMIRLPLSESPRFWAEKILEHAGNIKREDTSGLIQKAGYSISRETGRLAEIYKKMMER